MCFVVVTLLVCCSSGLYTNGQELDKDFDNVHPPPVFRVENKLSEEVRKGFMQSDNFLPNEYFVSYGLGNSNYDHYWTVWTEWSFCSRSCGGGVAMRTRRCGMRTMNDITNDCAGNDVQHKICNSKTCDDEDSFRATQCSKYNNREIYSRQNLQWLPYYGKDIQPCVLHCMPKGFEFYKSFGPVLDGTRCWSDSYDVCIEGECVEVGCDSIIGSNKTEDACGVCDGNNSTCYFYKGSITSIPTTTEGVAYTRVIDIPSGATHIKIKDNTRNYLAVSDANGYDVINADLVIGWPGDFTVAGTTIEYQRTSDDVTETLVAKGPTLGRMTIKLLNLGDEPNVEYEYWLPKSGIYDRSANRTQDSNLGYLGALEVVDSTYDDYFVGPFTTTTTTPTKTTKQTTTQSTTTTTTTKRDSSLFKSKKRRGKPAYCTPCRRPTNRRIHFCQSDFVIHARILSKKKVEGKRFSHDVLIKTVYKSGFQLMKREYLWVYSSCCPKLRPYRDYLIMGRKRRIERQNRNGIVQFAQNNGTIKGEFETRLVVDHMDYWHTWKRKYERGMQRVANSDICAKYKSRGRSNIGRDPESQKKRINRRQTT